MAIEIPPGILYLLRHSPQLLFPPTITYFLNHTSLSDTLQTYLSNGQTSVISNLSFGLFPFKASPQLAIAMIASVPLTLGVKILWDEVKIRIEAWRLGAVLPPRDKDWWPAGIGFLLKQSRLMKTGYLAEVLDETCEKLGTYTINTRVLYQNRITTSDPECIKIMLATQFDDFEKGPEVRWLFRPLLGTGVFAADGELWRFHRSMTRPYFNRDRITHFDIFDQYSEHALNKLAERVREGVAVDIQDLVGRFTLDSATTFLFGHNVQSLSGLLPYPHNHPLHSQLTSPETQNFSTRFAQAFSEAQLITAVRMRYSVMWPLVEFWRDRIKEPMRIVKDLIEPIVEEAIRKKRQRAVGGGGGGGGGGVGKEENGGGTFLENLVDGTDDVEILRDAIMSLLVAGRDTTASTLTYVIYMLAEHPHVLSKLREEILQKVGPYKRPEYDDLKEMKYLRATINETLRLYPAVPFNARSSKKATLWPSNEPNGKPYYIPANTRTMFSVWVMHRRKDLWGPDAHEFDPDRFIDDRLQKYLVANPFIFLPFNAGPRICLGQQFAYNETSFFLVRLLQRFDGFKVEVDAMPESARVPEEWKKDGRESRKGREKVKPSSHLTLHVKEGLWISLREASL